MIFGALKFSLSVVLTLDNRTTNNVMLCILGQQVSDGTDNKIWIWSILSIAVLL